MRMIRMLLLWIVTIWTPLLSIVWFPSSFTLRCRRFYRWSIRPLMIMKQKTIGLWMLVVMIVVMIVVRTIMWRLCMKLTKLVTDWCTNGGSVSNLSISCYTIGISPSRGILNGPLRIFEFGVIRWLMTDVLLTLTRSMWRLSGRLIVWCGLNRRLLVLRRLLIVKVTMAIFGKFLLNSVRVLLKALVRIRLGTRRLLWVMLMVCLFCVHVI